MSTVQWSGTITCTGPGAPRVLAACSEATTRDTADWYRRENGYEIEITWELLCPHCGGRGRIQKRKWSVHDCPKCKATGIVGQIWEVST